jgi:hypothetical protein
MPNSSIYRRPPIASCPWSASSDGFYACSLAYLSVRLRLLFTSLRQRDGDLPPRLLTDAG